MKRDAEINFFKPTLALVVALALLVLVYAPTLLAQINGSSDDFMTDVGETQIVLNVWGTLHSTGYPLFVILGNLMTGAMRTVGVSPSIAPTLVSLLWGLFALSLLFALTWHLTGRVVLAMSATWLVGLTRFVWIHNVIPEVYSFTLFFQILLFVLALWRRDIPHRIAWLAFVGGIAVSHYRTLILMAPALVYAVWDQFVAEIRRKPLRLGLYLLLGLVGLVPYIYLPLRANAGAGWVYGQPGTWNGWWDQFSGREAVYLFGLPASFDAFIANFNLFNGALNQELTFPIILIGLIGLIITARDSRRHRASITFLLAGIGAYVFAVLLYADILAPLVTAITLATTFGWVLWLDQLLDAPRFRQVIYVGIAPLALIFSAVLLDRNFNFIYGVNHDPTGLQTIALAKGAPPGSTVALQWGTHYYAIGFAQDVLGDLKQIRRADDRADFREIIASGMLVVPDFEFDDLTVPWWENRLGAKVYLRAAAPRLIQVTTTPERLSPAEMLGAQAYDHDAPITIVNQMAQCSREAITLQVAWAALQKPSRDLGVFVHLLDANGKALAQGDQSAPVYGRHPLTTWEAGEIVRDIYPLPYAPDAASIRFGLYEKLPSGEFKNYNTVLVPARCAPTAK